MTPIPVDLGWLILAGFILMPAMAYLASYEAKIDATRWHRKWVKTKEKALNEQAVHLLKQDIAVRKREDAVHEREVKLGRKALVVSALTKAALDDVNGDDAVPTMQEL